MVPEPPTHGLARAAKLAAIPAGFVGRRVWGLGRRVAGRPAELIAAEVQARTAEQLFATLGELKGGAMKAGQWMSAMQAALPEQFAGTYGQALTRLQAAAPAMPTSMMHRVMSQEFGGDWRARFAEFDDAPAAAASIGQVHRAVWSDDRPVAVKVQYPRAGEALATDLRQLDRLVPAAAGGRARLGRSRAVRRVTGLASWPRSITGKKQWRRALSPRRSPVTRMSSFQRSST